MKTLSFAVIFACLCLGLMGCTYVTSSLPTTESVNGEAWYVKETGFFTLVFSTKVYYCATPSGKGETTCIRAIMHDAGEGPSVSSSSSSSSESAPASTDESSSGSTEAPPTE